MDRNRLGHRLGDTPYQLRGRQAAQPMANATRAPAPTTHAFIARGGTRCAHRAHHGLQWQFEDTRGLRLLKRTQLLQALVPATVAATPFVGLAFTFVDQEGRVDGGHYCAAGRGPG